MAHVLVINDEAPIRALAIMKWALPPHGFQRGEFTIARIDERKH
jgi:hypothetical protein